MKTTRRFLKIKSSSVLLMRNVSGKSCSENQNTHFMFNNFFSFENRAVYEIMWKNIVEAVRPQMTIWRMRIACWIPKATNTHTHTHTEYVILFFHCNSGSTNAPKYYVVALCLSLLTFLMMLDQSGWRTASCTVCMVYPLHLSIVLSTAPHESKMWYNDTDDRCLSAPVDGEHLQILLWFLT